MSHLKYMSLVYKVALMFDTPIKNSLGIFNDWYNRLKGEFTVEAGKPKIRMNCKYIIFTFPLDINHEEQEAAIDRILNRYPNIRLAPKEKFADAI